MATELAVMAIRLRNIINESDSAQLDFIEQKIESMLRMKKMQGRMHDMLACLKLLETNSDKARELSFIDRLAYAITGVEHKTSDAWGPIYSIVKNNSTSEAQNLFYTLFPDWEFSIRGKDGICSLYAHNIANDETISLKRSFTSIALGLVTLVLKVQIYTFQKYHVENNPDSIYKDAVNTLVSKYAAQ